MSHISAKSLQSCGCFVGNLKWCETVWSLYLHVVEVQWFRFPTKEFTCFDSREFTTLEDKHGPGFMVISIFLHFGGIAVPKITVRLFSIYWVEIIAKPLKFPLNQLFSLLTVCVCISITISLMLRGKKSRVLVHLFSGDGFSCKRSRGCMVIALPLWMRSTSRMIIQRASSMAWVATSRSDPQPAQKSHVTQKVGFQNVFWWSPFFCVESFCWREMWKSSYCAWIWILS